MYKKIFLAVMLCLSSCIIFAQTEIPVNLYSGTPSIEIPLWTLTDHDISIPVALTYFASGVKLQQSDGWYGLGWNLIAAGSIQREVRGLPDDISSNPRRGWNYANSAGAGIASGIATFGNTADLYPSTCSDEQADQAAISAFGDVIDTEPDIFNFNFGGHSGSFVFDNSPVPVIRFIPHQDFTIHYTTISETNKSIGSFTIITNGGLKYTFGLAVDASRKAEKNTAINTLSFLERDYNQYNTNLGVNYNSEWKLTRVESPSGAIVDFAYSIFSSSSPSVQPVVLGMYTASAEYYKTVTPYTITENAKRYWLESITGSSGQRIEFKKTSGETLDNVIVSDSRRGEVNKQVKEYTLDYNVLWSRKFLNKITESSGCDKLPPYTFDYIGAENTTRGLPALTSSSKDYWGYYNGKQAYGSIATGTNSIPKMYIYPNEPPAERFRLYPIPAYNGTEVVLDGMDRVPDVAFAKIGTLNKVTYPTGGSLVIQYEGNTYYDNRTGQEYPAGGLRIKSISQFDGMNNPARITKIFDYADPTTGKSSGRLISRPTFVMPAWKYRNPGGLNNASADLLYANAVSTKTTAQLWKLMTIRTEFDLSEESETQGSPVGYQYVTVRRPGLGGARFEFTVPGTYSATAENYWVPTVSKFARPVSCPDMGIVTDAGAWAYPFVKNPSVDFERGLVASKYEFSESGNPVRFTQNIYQNIYALGTQPLLVTGLAYERYSNSEEPIYFYGKYTLPTEYERALAKETVTVYDAVASSRSMTEITEYFYSSSNHKYLSQIRKTTAEGTIYTSQFVYPIDYGIIPATAEPALQRIKDLQDLERGRSATIIEAIQYVKQPGGLDQVIGASLTTYSDFGMAGKILPQQKWSFRSSNPVSDFIKSGLQQGSAPTMLKDSRYELTQTILDFDTFENPLAQTGVDRKISSIIWGYNGTAQVASISNAAHGEFAFSDFETPTTDAFDQQNTSLAEARSGAIGYNPVLLLSKTITKATAANYLLSFWLKTPEVVTFHVLLKSTDLATTYYDSTFQISAAEEFQYVQRLISMQGIPNSFVIQVQGQPTSTSTGGSTNALPAMDDVAFYPENARITSFTYNFPFGTTSTTGSNGVASHTTYDNLGRPLYIYDQDKNIRSRSTYTFNQPVFSLSADFSVPITVYRDNEVIFISTGNDNACISGVQYAWDMGTGIFGAAEAATKSYTFTTAGTYTIRFKVSHPDYGEIIESKTISVVIKPIYVALCAVGTMAYDCGNPVFRDSNSCSTMPASGTLFIATAEAVPGMTYTWMKKLNSSTVWTTIGGATSSQYLLQAVSPMSEGFDVKCVINSPEGRTGTSREYYIDSTPCHTRP